MIRRVILESSDVKNSSSQVAVGESGQGARTVREDNPRFARNAVWDWDIATGVLARKSVAEFVTSLEPGA